MGTRIKVEGVWYQQCFGACRLVREACECNFSVQTIDRKRRSDEGRWCSNEARAAKPECRQCVRQRDKERMEGDQRRSKEMKSRCNQCGGPIDEEKMSGQQRRASAMEIICYDCAQMKYDTYRSSEREGARQQMRGPLNYFV